MARRRVKVGTIPQSPRLGAILRNPPGSKRVTTTKSVLKSKTVKGTKLPGFKTRNYPSSTY